MPTRPSSSTEPDKQALKAELVAALTAALEQARAAHQSAIEGAFHEEAKAENDKDTRGLEQSYLARGQAQRVAELETGVGHVAAMSVAAVDRATVGALVTLEDEDGELERYFIAPAGGGTILAGNIQVLTLSSPIGRAIANKRVDDEAEVALPKQRRTLTIRDLT